MPQELDIYNYAFVRSGKVPVFDAFIARNVCVHEDLPEKIAEIEKRFGCLVYAVTHEYFSFGEWNKSHEDCSEFGSVMIGCSCGGIVRLG